jgi:hypothetical protein
MEGLDGLDEMKAPQLQSPKQEQLFAGESNIAG